MDSPHKAWLNYICPTLVTQEALLFLHPIYLVGSCGADMREQSLCFSPIQSKDYRGHNYYFFDSSKCSNDVNFI